MALTAVERMPPVSPTRSPVGGKKATAGKNNGAATAKGNTTQRRQRHYWSQVEENALRCGIVKHGAGNWNAMLSDRSLAFDQRTAIDLKDKFRTMKKQQATSANYHSRQATITTKHSNDLASSASSQNDDSPGSDYGSNDDDETDAFTQDSNDSNAGKFTAANDYNVTNSCIVCIKSFDDGYGHKSTKVLVKDADQTAWLEQGLLESLAWRAKIAQFTALLKNQLALAEEITQRSNSASPFTSAERGSASGKLFNVKRRLELYSDDDPQDVPCGNENDSGSARCANPKASGSSSSSPWNPPKAQYEIGSDQTSTSELTSDLEEQIAPASTQSNRTANMLSAQRPLRLVPSSSSQMLPLFAKQSLASSFGHHDHKDDSSSFPKPPPATSDTAEHHLPEAHEPDTKAKRARKYANNDCRRDDPAETAAGNNGNSWACKLM